MSGEKSTLSNFDVLILVKTFSYFASDTFILVLTGARCLGFSRITSEAFLSRRSPTKTEKSFF